MSDARSRNRDLSAGGAPQHVAPPAPAQPVSRRWLVACFVLAGLWSLALLLMDVLTTGRPVVGPGQLLQADVVVIATLDAADQERVAVERVFKGDAAEGSRLRIINLHEVRRLETGRPYIFALTRIRNDYTVTKLDGQKGDLLVYPSLPATIEQTKAILRDNPKP